MTTNRITPSLQGPNFPLEYSLVNTRWSTVTACNSLPFEKFTKKLLTVFYRFNQCSGLYLVGHVLPVSILHPGLFGPEILPVATDKPHGGTRHAEAAVDLGADRRPYEAILFSFENGDAVPAFSVPADHRPEVARADTDLDLFVYYV